ENAPSCYAYTFLLVHREKGSLLQVLQRLRQKRPKPLNVDPHVLLPEVPLGHVSPPAQVHGDGVLDHGVVLAEHVHQRALVGGDVVLDVPEPHVSRRLAEVRLRDALEPAVRHDLQQHGPRGEEHAVGQPGAVHAHHHVVRVHLPGELVVGARRTAAGDGHLEPRRSRGRGDLREVHQLPAVGPLQDHHPRPCTVVGTELDRPVTRERVGLPQELGEVDHGVAAAGVVEGGVDGELLAAAIADHHVRVTADDAAVVVLLQVDDVVPRDLAEDPPVLVHPEGQQVDDEELDLAAEATRADEERDEHVGEVVPVVAGEPAELDHHRRDVQPRRARRGVLRVGDGPHRDGFEAVEVLPGVGLYLPLPRRRARRDQGDHGGAGAAASLRSRVAVEHADVVLAERRVADRLGVGNIVEVVRSSS
ncbi:Os04g0196850, partial [Oryza sativa Japonica Group]